MSEPSECGICANVRVLHPYHGELHSFCNDCIAALRRVQAPCPLCRATVNGTGLPASLCRANNQGWFASLDNFPPINDIAAYRVIDRELSLDDMELLPLWVQGVHHCYRLQRMIISPTTERIEHLKVASSYFRFRLERTISQEVLYSSLGRLPDAIPAPRRSTLERLYSLLLRITEMFYGEPADVVLPEHTPVPVAEQTYELLARLVRDRAPAATIQAASNLYALVSQAGSD